MSCVFAPAPMTGDGYGPSDQLHVQPAWISRNTPGIAELRVGPLYNPDNGTSHAMRCIRARIEGDISNGTGHQGCPHRTHDGLICAWCARDLTVHLVDENAPSTEAQCKAWIDASSRSCDSCILARSILRADTSAWQCLHHEVPFMICRSCADACATTTRSVWYWYQREVDYELPVAHESNSQKDHRRDRNRKREEQCLRELDPGAAAEHDDKKARQLAARRQLKQPTLQF